MDSGIQGKGIDVGEEGIEIIVADTFCLLLLEQASGVKIGDG